MTRCGFAALGIALLSACQIMNLDPPRQKIVDLTHPLDAQTIFWPTETGFVLEKEFAGTTERGYFYAANKFSSPEHGGTHLDAPFHFSATGKTVDQIPLDQLTGPAVLIDATSACQGDADYQIKTADFLAWEKRNGKIPAGSIVLLRTGFGKFWPDRRRYLGTDERGAAAVAKLHFPGLHPEAARWLAEERRIQAVGIDTASIDRGQSRLFETHRALFERDIPAMENLANLELLPERGFEVIALPMKIAGGSGAPLRAIARLPGQ
ncbi:MAG: cyclase family protein [bacterium]